MKKFTAFGFVILMLALLCRAATPEEEERFLKAVREAYTKKDKEAIVALTCWDDVPAGLKKLAPKALDAALRGKVVSVEYIPMDVSSPMTVKKGEIVYGPNLRVTKAIEIDYAAGEGGDSRTARVFVGEKGGKLMIANLAPMQEGDTALVNPFGYSIGGPSSWTTAPETLTSKEVKKIDPADLNKWVREQPPAAFLVPRSTDTEDGSNPWVKIFVGREISGTAVQFLAAARDAEKKILPGYKLQKDVGEMRLNGVPGAAYTFTFASNGAEDASNSTMLRVLMIPHGSFIYVIAISSPVHPSQEIEEDFAAILSTFRFTK